MILLEQLQKFIRMPPLRFVVILDYERLVDGCGLRGGNDRQHSDEEKKQGENAGYAHHKVLLERI
jgi:hypothetical protein